MSFIHFSLDDPTPPGILQQGRMNIMSTYECGQNIATLTGNPDTTTYRYILDSNHLFCAGSIPNKHGINPCKVISHELKEMNY